MLGLSMFASVSKHNMWWYYVWVCRFRQSVNTICDRIIVGFVVLSRPSVSTKCGGNMVGFVIVVVSQ